MTSSSSLYGTTTTQNSSSSNSTSLYGEAGTPIPDSSGNVVVRGDLYVLSGNILTTALTGNIFPANATTINIGLAATAFNLGANTGTTTVNNNLVVDGTGTFAGDITATGADFGDITIGVADDQTITTTSGELRVSSATGIVKLPSVTSLYTDTTGTFNLLNQPTTVNAFRDATVLELGESTGTTGINNNLRIDGTSINLAQGTSFLYSENNSRFNRPTIQSTSGNTSGLRVAAPNTGSSAQGLFSVLNSSDNLNAEFLQMGSRGSALSNTFRFLTGEYIAGVLGPTNKSISFVDDTNTYATVNPAGPTIGTDLTTKTYVDAQVSGGVTSVTGGTHVTASPTTGAVVVTTDATNVNTASTIVARDASGNFSAGTITAALTGNATTATTAAQVANSLTAGTHLSGGPFNGSAAVTLTTDATDANTASTIVARNASGNFSASQGTFTTVATPTIISGGSALTITGGAVGPSILTVDGGQTTLALDGGLGGDDSTLTTTAGSLTWAHTAGAMVPGSVNGTWNWNADGTTDFPNYTFPYADGTANQVLKTDGTGNLSWFTPADLNTTYDFNATSASGGANLNLVGSDATTDTVKLTDGGHITAAYTSGTAITLGSDATDANTASTIVARDASGNFAASGATLGNVTVGVDTDQTISTTSGNLVLQTAAGVDAGTITLAAGANGNITLAPNGTGDIHLNSDAIRIGDNNATATLATRGTGDLVLTTHEGSGVEGTITIANGANGDITLAPNGTGSVILSDNSYVLGQLVATRNTAYVAPASSLTTVAGLNGMVVSSSSGGAGYGANIAVRYHSGDTTAGTNSAASLNFSGASGTNSAPGGAATNQVLGSNGYDGYTAGTSNNYASTIATVNQGAGTASIVPLQAQGYARQAFTNSTTFTTAVTGASGTGSVATLTFTTQNTAPYVVGQTVTIAGMTPAGYNNAAAVITAATTSSISYANTTTGFTSGGTIAAANTVTAAGMGFRVRGFANSTNMTAGNRFNFMDLTASTATFKSAAYTFANDVITGSTLTATNYMTLGSSGHTMGNVDGITNIIRASGATAIAFNIANGDQTSAIMTVVQPLVTKLSSTTISATASPTATAGGNTLSTVAVFDAAKISASVPFKFPTYTAAAANAITGAVGWQISISDSPTVGGRMAFWDTTNSRWSYISDNSAV